MRRFTVKHRYSARRDGQHLGPWEAGTQVELSEADAEWVNRDSPGALAPLTDKPAPKPTPEAPRQDAPKADRGRRGSANRGA